MRARSAYVDALGAAVVGSSAFFSIVRLGQNAKTDGRQDER
jgi:hypothetical protein